MGPEMSLFEQKIAFLQITHNQPHGDIEGYSYLCSIPNGLLSTYYITTCCIPVLLLGRVNFDSKWVMLKSYFYSEKIIICPLLGWYHFRYTLMMLLVLYKPLKLSDLVCGAIYDQKWAVLIFNHRMPQHDFFALFCFYSPLLSSHQCMVTNYVWK